VQKGSPSKHVFAVHILSQSKSIAMVRSMYRSYASPNVHG
jgi:hypothetical protein